MKEISQNFTIVDGKIIFNGQVLPPREGIMPRPKHPEKNKTETSRRPKRKPSPRRLPFIESP